MRGREKTTLVRTAGSFTIPLWAFFSPSHPQGANPQVRAFFPSFLGRKRKKSAVNASEREGWGAQAASPRVIILRTCSRL